MKLSIKKILRSVGVIGIAVLVAVALIKLRPRPEKHTPPPASLLVDVMDVKASSPVMTVKSYGTVRPSESLSLVSEVSGKIVELARNFKDGGVFEKGQWLIRIDPRSYELAVAAKKKQLKQLDAENLRLEQERKNLETTLDIARGDVDLAEADWERSKALIEREVISQSRVDQAEQRYLASRNKMQEIENQLALIDPRTDQLKAQTELVQVQLNQALLDLDRTHIKAPFDGRVLKKEIEEAQFVSAGSLLGRVYRLSTLEVEVRIPFKDLHWLKGAGSLENTPAGAMEQFLPKGPIRAELRFESAGQAHTWNGQVDRVKAEVDEKTRTLPLVIEVSADASSGLPQPSYPLTPGMFVNVELVGKKIDRAYLLPRSAIHAGDVVYLADDDRLVMRPVEVIRRLNDSLYVGNGLEDGDRVIVTPITAPKEGMPLTIRHVE